MNFQNPAPSSEFQHNIANFRSEIMNVVKNIEHVIKGKEEVIKQIMTAVCSDGHVLLKDVPGVGKTVLAKSLAKSIHADFKRIQFTPDLLPTDITGVSIYNPKTNDFEFKQGPVFTNILLADEINRASPKTQSALLEAMEERQVSVDNTQHKLPNPFFVIATKNPLEHAGTYPLPAAQLDRFMMRLSVGYPTKDVELQILKMKSGGIKPIDEIQPVVSAQHIIYWREAASQIYVSDLIDHYIVDLCRATRADRAYGQGMSPRAMILLKKAAKAAALIEGRDYVIPDDVKNMAKVVIPHRLSSGEKVGEAQVEEILEKVSIV